MHRVLSTLFVIASAGILFGCTAFAQDKTPAPPVKDEPPKVKQGKEEAKKEAPPKEKPKDEKAGKEGQPAKEEPQESPEEQTLKAAKLPTDGPGLLDFFRKRSL